ncbi:MAG: AAA-like domain-containing protein [Acidobacteriota bacterium]
MMRERVFNTAGPCDPEWHYMLPPERRLQRVETLIDRAQYFVVHAPRQVGKTTSFRALADRLTAEGQYVALLASCEAAQAAGDDAERGVTVLVREIETAAMTLPSELRPPKLSDLGDIEPLLLLRVYLARWAERCPRPIVLCFDEIDSLLGTTLISVLRQLRTGYPDRPRRFPHSVALIGLRDVRDYRLEANADGPKLGTSSPFNIKVESLRLRDFTAEEVVELYRQHEAETGQRFTASALDRAFELTQGQPWLVNALARQLVEDERPDRREPIDLDAVESSKEKLILRRDTHLDSLAERLRERRVRRVIEPLVAGDFLGADVTPDDLDYVIDLGLVWRQNGDLSVANPIYREVIPRSLAVVLESSIPVSRLQYVDLDGRLRVETLLDEFGAFWRENAESFLKRTPYSEAAAQLIFMAFLHKVVNGGGFIDREYAVGAGRIDLCLRWPHGEGVDRFAFELKVRRKAPVRERGIDQLVNYLERLGLDRGILVVFDVRKDAIGVGSEASRESVVHRGREVLIATY